LTKAELEERVLLLGSENRRLKTDVDFLEEECKNMGQSIKILGKTLHEVYKCYPCVLGECCTEPELIKLFKVQDALKGFLDGLTDKPEKEKEDEI